MNDANKAKSNKPAISSETADDPQSLGGTIDMEKWTFNEASTALLRVFNYSASLPERTLRSASALAGELFASQLTGWYHPHFEIPSPIRSSSSKHWRL